MSRSEFLWTRKRHRLVPVIIEFPLGHRPVTSLFQSFRKGSINLLLQSATPNKLTGLYSIMARAPFGIFQCKNGTISVTGRVRDAGAESCRDHPFDVLRHLIARFQTPRSDHWPVTAGAFGFLSYEALHYFESVRPAAADDLNCPDIWFAFMNELVVVDHGRNRFAVIYTSLESDDDRAWEDTQRHIETMCRDVQQGSPKAEAEAASHDARANPLSIAMNMTKDDFLKMVDRAKSYIAAGDIYQANLSIRLHSHFSGNSFELFRELSHINPSPFAFYFETPQFCLIGSSPERLLKLSGSEVVTRPIAGTRPRRRDPMLDHDMEQQLTLNAKERAEHIMLVDLERNDLGRVCEYGSVRVDQLMMTERYSHVMHIVSNIVGRLRCDSDGWDLIRACFPGGTITGTPKIRAMEIINELEPTARGPYTGSAGYFSFSGDLDFNIIIRTILLKDQTAYVQAGAGIVADSVSYMEFHESLAKAEAMLEAIRIVQSAPPSRIPH